MEVKKFSNYTVYFNAIKPSKTSESIKTITTTNTEVGSVIKEVMVYTEEDHLKNSSEEIIDLYNKIKEFIFSLNDNITIKAKKLEIGFVYNNKIMVDILLQKRGLKLWLNTKMGTIDDSKNIAKDMSKTGHWGNGDYEILISDDEELEYVFSLIKQVYKIKSN